VKKSLAIKPLAVATAIFALASQAHAACSTATLATGTSTSLLFQPATTPYAPLVGVYDAASGLCTTINADGGLAVHLNSSAVVGTAAPASQRSGSTGAQTGTGAVSISNSSLAANYTYVTDLECGRSDAGTVAITITLNDGATTVLVVPNSGGGGGWTKTFATPLKVSSAVNTALTVTAGTSVTSYYCSAQGFFAAN
jgi:hypothetical protein